MKYPEFDLACYRGRTSYRQRNPLSLVAEICASILPAFGGSSMRELDSTVIRVIRYRRLHRLSSVTKICFSILPVVDGSSRMRELDSTIISYPR